MRSPKTVRAAEEFGRARLSRSFFMRDFLYREISNVHGIPNLPGDPGLAIAAGSRFCQDLLQATFGRLTVRSAYRTRAMNALGNARHYNCASNARSYARHIWDRRDSRSSMGAMACIVIPWFVDRLAEGARWQAMAWWIHDPYSQLQFFPKLGAFNIGAGAPQARNLQLHPSTRLLNATWHAEPFRRPRGPLSVCPQFCRIIRTRT